MSGEQRSSGMVDAVVMGENLEVNVNGEDVDEVLEALAEEADPKRLLPTPTMPTLREVLKHREDHIPYQSWCDWCVEGRGREMGHSCVDMSTRSIPTIALDYFFVNDKGLFTNS